MGLNVNKSYQGTHQGGPNIINYIPKPIPQLSCYMGILKISTCSLLSPLSLNGNPRELSTVGLAFVRIPETSTCSPYLPYLYTGILESLTCKLISKRESPRPQPSGIPLSPPRNGVGISYLCEICTRVGI